MHVYPSNILSSILVSVSINFILGKGVLGKGVLALRRLENLRFFIQIICWAP